MVAKHRAPPVRRPERLTVGELAGLDLGADLVVLSACRSLGGRSVDGDWLTGLTRAFLVAGSSGVVCTTMDTADRAALRIVPTMYHVLLREQEESGDSVDVPAALRKLKLDCLDTVDSHPSIWAPWIYHGRVPHG